MLALRLDGLYFQLPDDFKGTRADAIRLLADYDESTPDVIVPNDTIDRWHRFARRM